MARTRAELKIGEPGGPDNFVWISCYVELTSDTPSHPWTATDADDETVTARGASRTEAVLGLFAARLGGGERETTPG